MNCAASTPSWWWSMTWPSSTEIAQQGVVTVLHEGSVLAQGTMSQVQSDERVIEVYLGR
jgi:ABC-type branched-subunit amino acid transport system ATPase component